MNPMLSLLLTACLMNAGLTAHTQTSRFTRPQQLNDAHTLYTYRKSNQDGSHASYVFLYVKDSVTLQSFKWSEGDEESSLVTAVFNWDRFAMQRLQNYRVQASGERKLFAELAVNDKAILHFKVMNISDSVQLQDPFWHSYDFDFASLAYCWRALRQKDDGFHFLIADAGMKDGKPAFENKGMVTAKFAGEESVHGKLCLKYGINGEGLQNKGGYIWINPEHYMIEQFKIALPDEEGMKDGFLELQSVSSLTPAEWDAFIKKKLNGQ